MGQHFDQSVKELWATAAAARAKQALRKSAAPIFDGLERFHDQSSLEAIVDRHQKQERFAKALDSLASMSKDS